MSPSGARNAAGIVLVVAVGLFNFRVAHLLIERTTGGGFATQVLELALLGNLIGAVIAALGIYLDGRWGWWWADPLAGYVPVCRERWGLQRGRVAVPQNRSSSDPSSRSPSAGPGAAAVCSPRIRTTLGDPA